MDIPPIEPFTKRLAEIDALMQASDFYSDQRRAAELGREHQKLTELVGLHAKLTQTASAIKEHETMLADPATDADLRTTEGEGSRDGSKP